MFSLLQEYPPSLPYYIPPSDIELLDSFSRICSGIVWHVARRFPLSGSFFFSRRYNEGNGLIATGLSYGLIITQTLINSLSGSRFIRLFPIGSLNLSLPPFFFGDFASRVRACTAGGRRFRVITLRFKLVKVFPNTERLTNQGNVLFFSAFFFLPSFPGSKSCKRHS